MTAIECAICFENISSENVYYTECMHSFCKECFGKWKETCQKDVTCPSCRYVLEKRETIQNYEPEVIVTVRVLSNYQPLEEDSEEEDSMDFDYPDEEEIEEEDKDDYSSYKEDKYVSPYLSQREYLQDREDYNNFVQWFNRR